MAKTMDIIRFFKVVSYDRKIVTQYKHYRYTYHEFYIMEVALKPFFNKNGEKRVEVSTKTWRERGDGHGNIIMKGYVDRQKVMTADEANAVYVKLKNTNGATREIPEALVWYIH